MPYVHCPRCARSCHSVAFRLSADRCVFCDAELPRPRSFASAYPREDTLRSMPAAPAVATVQPKTYVPIAPARR
jgi:hypothetical protein